MIGAWLIAIPDNDSATRWLSALVLTGGIGLLMWMTPVERQWMVLIPVAFAVRCGYVLATRTRIVTFLGVLTAFGAILTAVTNPNVANLFRH